MQLQRTPVFSNNHTMRDLCCFFKFTINYKGKQTSIIVIKIKKKRKDRYVHNISTIRFNILQ